MVRLVEAVGSAAAPALAPAVSTMAGGQPRRPRKLNLAGRCRLPVCWRRTGHARRRVLSRLLGGGRAAS